MYIFGIYWHHTSMLCTRFLGNISVLALSEVQATRAGPIWPVLNLLQPLCKGQNALLLRLVIHLVSTALTFVLVSVDEGADQPRDHVPVASLGRSLHLRVPLPARNWGLRKHPALLFVRQEVLCRRPEDAEILVHLADHDHGKRSSHPLHTKLQGAAVTRKR